MIDIEALILVPKMLYAPPINMVYNWEWVRCVQAADRRVGARNEFFVIELIMLME